MSFLDYVAGRKSDDKEDSYVKKLEEAVKEAKKKQGMEGAGHLVDVRLARTETEWRKNI